MGKSTAQVKQQNLNEINDDSESAKAAAAAAAVASSSSDENCFLNPTLAAFNYGNLFYCNFCGFSANNTNKILHHLFIHVFKCSSCSHFTYTKYDLMKHIYKYHRPNKELKIKRLVLEVTSNDWYFLCSENEPHNLTSSLNDEYDGVECFNVNNEYKSIDKTSSSAVSGKSQLISHQQHTRLVQSNQYFDEKQESSSSSKIKADTTASKKPVTNFFLPKVQKSPEKLTQVIQRNQPVSETDGVLNTSNNSDSGCGGVSQLKKLMNKDTSNNPTSKIVIPTINTMKMMNAQGQQTTTTASSKQSSISTLINNTSSPSTSSNLYNQKLMVYMESTGSQSNSASSTPGLASNKPKRQIRKPLSIQDKIMTPKTIKKPKKCTF